MNFCLEKCEIQFEIEHDYVGEKELFWEFMKRYGY